MPLARLLIRSDDQLVAAFRAGDERAFERIHDRYRERLQAFVRSMVRNDPHTVEDVVQDVWIRAYNGLRAHDREMDLRPWLYRIAHNRTMDAVRGPARPGELPEVLPARAAGTAEHVEERERLREVVSDIQGLPVQQRAALTLREMQGISYQEIAEALDVTVPAVKSLLIRARVGLAEAAEARAGDCTLVRRELADGGYPSARVRGHLRTCATCAAAAPPRPVRPGARPAAATV
jgi:RNA polymerase sigma factor (sigma-70 family)